MMAGVGAARLAGGALPPHLLHSATVQAQQQQEPNSARYGGHHFYSRGAPPGSAAISQAQPSPPSHRQAAPSLGPPSFRSPLSNYANRLGEITLKSGDKDKEKEKDKDESTTDDPSHLTLIAAPRALRAGNTGGQLMSPRVIPLNHRLRRSVRAEKRAAEGQSTDIKTQKTIQVVSPDDVAFSLLSQPASAATTDEFAFKRSPSGGDESSVCFSAHKLIFAILITMATLAVSIVIVVYYILKQRAQLMNQEKVATFFNSTGAAVKSAAPVCSNDQPLSSQGAASHHLLANHRRRQEEEMKQRDRYLDRLYSQFSPVAYWR